MSNQLTTIHRLRRRFACAIINKVIKCEQPAQLKTTRAVYLLEAS